MINLTFFPRLRATEAFLIVCPAGHGMRSMAWAMIDSGFRFPYTQSVEPACFSLVRAAGFQQTTGVIPFLRRNSP